MKVRENKFAYKYQRILVTNEFIRYNRLSLLKTSQQIIERIYKNINYCINNDKDHSESESNVLIHYLTLADVHAKNFMTQSYVKKVQNLEIKHSVVTDIEECAQDFLDYMVFVAWDKASYQIDLQLILENLIAWLWLMGRDDLVTILQDKSIYNPYGINNMIKVCQNLAIDIPEEILKTTQQHTIYEFDL